MPRDRGKGVPQDSTSLSKVRYLRKSTFEASKYQIEHILHHKVPYLNEKSTGRSDTAAMSREMMVDHTPRSNNGFSYIHTYRDEKKSSVRPQEEEDGICFVAIRSSLSGGSKVMDVEHRMTMWSWWEVP